MKRAFTMIELVIAVSLVGVLTTLSIAVFHQVSRSWQISCDYMDKMQRTDFALTQLVSGLRSMYYPHDGKVDERYGFMLTDNGDGEDPDDSDVIEWSKIGSAIVGNKSAIADTVHRVQVMVLEEGTSDYRDADGRPIEIQKTGLYARQCPDVALRSGNEDDEVDYTFENDEMYEPVLIADGIVGFDCKVMKTAEEAEGKNDEERFEDEFSESNSVPYKLQLTFRIADPEGKSYRSNTAPIMRIVRIPIHEQSLDGASTPSDDQKAASSRSGRGGSGGGGKSGGGTGGGATGGGATGGGVTGGRGASGGGVRGGGVGGGMRGGGTAPTGPMPPGGAR